MAKATTFQCQLITPEDAVLDQPVSFAAFTAHDGEVGVLPGRVPLLTKLGVGELRVEVDDGTRRFFIDGGFAQVLDNELTVLTTSAQAGDEIDVRAAEDELQTLRNRAPSTSEERAEVGAHLRRCAARLKVARASQ